MNQEEKDKLTGLLQSALPPMRDRALSVDLWPRMRRRLDRQPVQIAWFDLALAALAAAGFIACPAVIPWVMFQF